MASSVVPVPIGTSVIYDGTDLQYAGTLAVVTNSFTTWAGTRYVLRLAVTPLAYLTGVSLSSLVIL